MKASDVGYLMRKTLALVYQTNVISLSAPDHEPGKSFSLTVIAPTKTMVKGPVVLDGTTVAEDTSPLGDPIEAKGWWEGDKLVFEKKRLMDGSITRETRWIEGDRMRHRLERLGDNVIWFEQVFERIAQ
eukprot:c5041_g1_i1.p1 GENE.c5041_g1_i1~~c5041_g1_i1.p1  ORF type:complete len:129 (+),score=28.27 c5041_g1_i1:140-526(+)